MPTFQPPTADHVPAVSRARDADPRANALMRFYKNRARGLSVLKIGGVYQTIETPTQDQCDAATEVYLGGHVYTVSTDTATALEAAGYDVAGFPTTGGDLRAVFGLGFPLVSAT